MIVVNRDGTLTVMLATKSAVYAAYSCGLAVLDGNHVELHPAFALGLAQGHAEALGGEVLRTWHDHNAGAVLAEIGFAPEAEEVDNA